MQLLHQYVIVLKAHNKGEIIMYDIYRDLAGLMFIASLVIIGVTAAGAIVHGISLLIF